MDPGAESNSRPTAPSSKRNRRLLVVGIVAPDDGIVEPAAHLGSEGHSVRNEEPRSVIDRLDR